jgi:signal transduction histidine kinase/predicted negative regulator of RcsB-dependent stress response
MQIKKILGVGLYFLVIVTAHAQISGQQMIDSLLLKLPSAKEDTFKTKMYYNIAQAYIPIDPDKALLYSDSGMTHSIKMSWEKGIAFMHLTKGNILNDQGKGELAIKEYEQAYAIGKKINNRLAMSSALIDIGGFYYRKSDYVNAVTNYTSGLKIAEELKDHNLLGTCYSNLYSVYFAQKDFDRAIEYANKALLHFKKLNSLDKVARTTNYIGNVYYEKGDHKKAEEYYNKALKVYEATNNRTGIAILYSQIAIIQPNQAKTIEYQERSQAIWDDINPQHYNSIINLGNMGESYLTLVRNDSLKKITATERTRLLNKAGEYLERCLRYSRETDDQDNLGYYSNTLAQLQELRGDYKSAIVNYKLSYAMQDSLYSQANKNKIAAIESQREIDLRDKEIQIGKLALTNERKMRIAMIAGIGLLFIIGLLLYWQSHTRKKTNTTLLQLNNELDEANKVKARFFAILSHDLRSPVANLISFLELQEEEPGILNAEEAATHKLNIRNSAKSLLETMEAMLLWSKGQMESFKPQIRPVPVNSLFDYLRAAFNNTGNVQINFSNPSNLLVNTDDNYLQTIMHNLTANALNALKKAPGAKIEWEARQQGDKIILSITDNGPGIDDEQVKALYDNSAVPNARTGLGLHLVRDLAKAVQCKITMQSQPGAGTTFTLFA